MGSGEKMGGGGGGGGGGWRLEERVGWSAVSRLTSVTHTYEPSIAHV